MADQAKLIVEARWGLAPSMISGRRSDGIDSSTWESTPDDQKWPLIQGKVDELMGVARAEMRKIPQELNYVAVEAIWL